MLTLLGTLCIFLSLAAPFVAGWFRDNYLLRHFEASDADGWWMAAMIGWAAFWMWIGYELIRM